MQTRRGIRLNRTKRTEELLKALNQRILVLDGAMGTAIQDRNLKAEDFGGADLEGCNENLILTRPDIIGEIYDDLSSGGLRYRRNVHVRGDTARSG